MKLLFLDIVWPLYLADGSLIHRHELVSNLAKLKNEIHIFTTDSSTLSHLDNIRCHYVRPGSLPALTINYFRSFAGLISSETFDVMYTRNPNFGFLAGLFYRNRCKALVYELNGIPEDETNLMKSRNSEGKSLQESRIGELSRLLSSAKSRLKILVLKKALVFSDKIIAVTPGIKATLENVYQIPGDKITVVPNGANTSLFKRLEQYACRKDLGLDPGAPYICFVGNLAPWQGVEYLVKAAPSILSRYPDCYFLIVGDGVMKDGLLTLSRNLGIEDRFVFTGVVPYHRVPVYINASDVCTAPFILERNAKIGLSPLKLYEYMACGKPVVASAISGVVDALEASKGGLSVPSENPEAIADAILKLLENQDLRMNMGSKGLSYVTENYSWYSVAKKVDEVCKSGLKN